jgi:hypothetical protein
MKELSAVATSEPFGETTDKVLNFCGCDDKFFRDDDGVTTLCLQKWFPFNDEILRLLGECGRYCGGVHWRGRSYVGL